MILFGAMAIVAIEYAVRISPKFKALARGPLQLTFEPTIPWVERIRDASTPPPSNPDLPRSQWVKTDSLWFKVQVINNRPAHVVRGVRVFMTNVQLLQGGVFQDIGFGTQRELRWAYEGSKPFAPRDIHYLEKHYVDVLSVGDVHNKIFVKWPPSPKWLTYEKLFDTPGIYKLGLIANSDGGDAATINLNLAWPGRWDQVSMWLDDLLVATAKAKECLWNAFHAGVDLRNAGQKPMLSPASIEWDVKFFAWREIALGFAGCLSVDLKHHLQTMNQIDPKNVAPDVSVSVASEMLARIQKFLTRDL